MLRKGEVIRTYPDAAVGLNMGLQQPQIHLEKRDGVTVSEDYGTGLLENKLCVEDFVKIQQVFEIKLKKLHQLSSLVHFLGKSFSNPPPREYNSLGWHR
ncbi:WD repeat-containing protein 49 [Cricetulus griseus]|nr:WD repeat-containing protein 49 [Cricetulus griseus]